MGALCIAALVAAAMGSSAAEPARRATGPLRIHPRNPRYFADASGKVVYLAGSHTWASFLDHGPTDAPAPFDYAAHLDLLRAHGLNFLKLWVRENARWAPEPAAKDWFFAPMPYARTGPGSAPDGKPRFDLNRFDQGYFDRLRARATAARDRGIYVAVMLFQGWSVFDGTASLAGANPWRGHYFHKDNNTNGVDGDLNGDGEGYEVHTLGNPAVTRYQEAYVRKVVDTVNDLDNVLYEISNESRNDSHEWQYHMIRFIRAYEAGKPKQHPIGMTGGWDDNPALFASPADWVSPGKEDSSANKASYRDDPPANDGSKVILSDTDHLGGAATPPSSYLPPWVWRTFTRGHNPILMDRLERSDVTHGQKNALMPAMRAALGHTMAYARKMDLSTAVPRGDLSSTTYCLANPGVEYLVYQPNPGAAFTLDLAAGMYRYEWLDAAKGAVAGGGKVDWAGGRRQFEPPFAGDAVLHLRRGR